jgi:hypothetical protein
MGKADLCRESVKVEILFVAVGTRMAPHRVASLNACTV